MNQIDREVLKSISTEIAVIDSSGNIVFLNKAWMEFAIKNSEFNSIDRNCMGSNYFVVLEMAILSGDNLASGLSRLGVCCY